MNDDELEDMFRRSLSTHATEAMAVPDPAAKAHAGVRRRRRVVGAVAAAAAIVVIAPAAVLAVNLGHGGSNAAAPPAPPDWRAESYNGIELRVPASWGWGGIPTPGCNGSVGNVGYVGRPGPTEPGAHTCIATKDETHVWFGSPEPVGSHDGVTTVRVKGATQFNITVADPDTTVLQQILDSIRSVTVDGYGCPVVPKSQPGGTSPPDASDVTSVSVCIYSGDQSPTSHATLFYSTAVTADPGGVVDAIASSGTGPRGEPADLCRGTPSEVDLIATTKDTSFAYWINPDPCGGQAERYGPEGNVLTRHSVSLWAIDGVPLYGRGIGEANRLSDFLPPLS